MADFYWHTRSILRSHGSSAVALAAYRAGERLRSTYQGRVYDWLARQDIEHQEIILPKDPAQRRDMLWARDRGTLWNQVERHETGETPRLGRKWLMHLPTELSRGERRDLSLAYAREVADKYGCAVDVCVHEPRPESGGQYYHVHLMTTVRMLSPRGFGQFISLEVPGFQRQQQGIKVSYKEECGTLRKCWAELMNVSLERAGVPDRVDHRSAQERGVTPAPVLKLPEKLFYHERDKGPTAEGDLLRARHQALKAAYEQGPEVYARVSEEYKAKARDMYAERRQQRASQPKAPDHVRRGALTHEQLKEKRRQEYQAEREQLKNDPEALALARAKNRERMRQWRAANRERDTGNRLDWEKRNPERVKAKAKKYYDAHAAEIAERRKEKYHADLEGSRSKVRASYYRCALRERLLKLSMGLCGEKAEGRRRKGMQKGMQAAGQEQTSKRPPEEHRGELERVRVLLPKQKQRQQEKQQHQEETGEEARSYGYDLGLGLGD